MDLAKIAIIFQYIMVVSVETLANPDEKRLLDYLLKDYQIYERPVKNESDPIKLEFGISLQQIIDLDERNQLLKSNMWLEYSWIDENLRWNKV